VLIVAAGAAGAQSTVWPRTVSEERVDYRVALELARRAGYRGGGRTFCAFITNRSFLRTTQHTTRHKSM
jgi:hypothetical protein